MIFIMYGPSGSGKTLAGEYLKSLGINELVSHTTRKRRPGEVHGQSYYFVNQEEFENLKKVEQSVYAGEHYGVSEEEVIRQYKNDPVFVVADKNGATAFKKRFEKDTLVIKIMTSPRQMRVRMKKRGETEEIIRKRMKYHIKERKNREQFHADYTIYNNTSIRSFNKKLYITIIRARNQKK